MFSLSIYSSISNSYILPQNLIINFCSLFNLPREFTENANENERYNLRDLLNKSNEIDKSIKEVDILQVSDNLDNFRFIDIL